MCISDTHTHACAHTHTLMARRVAREGTGLQFSYRTVQIDQVTDSHLFIVKSDAASASKTQMHAQGVGWKVTCNTEML